MEELNKDGLNSTILIPEYREIGYGYFPAISPGIIIENRTQADYDELANDHVEDLISKIHSAKKRIDAPSSVASKGLFTGSVYSYEKAELESVFNFLTDISGKAMISLTRIPR